MLVLAGLDKLKDSSFPVDDVTPELLMTLDEYNMIPYEAWLKEYYLQIIPLLRDGGRQDLVDALNQVAESWYLKHKKEE